MYIYICVHRYTHTYIYIPTDWDKPPSSKHGGFPQFIWDSTEKENSKHDELIGGLH